MKSNLLKTSLATLGLVIAASAAHATPVLPGTESSLQTEINTLYTNAGTPTSAAPDVNLNQVAGDQLWAIEGSGGAVASFIIEIAGNASSNTFGIYNPSNSNLVQLFGGPATQADKANVIIGANGSAAVTFYDLALDGSILNSSVTLYGAGTFSGNSFGFYLGTTGGTFYSETAKNAGNSDQMVAYKGDGDLIKLPGALPGTWGSSSYILAWEDTLYANGDKDFNDLVVYVESVHPAPEPATLGLLGLGLIGLAGGAMRRRKTAA